jgi:hypothetical protein
MINHKKIEKIKAETLLALMREVLDQTDDFIYISGVQPFLMSFINQKYYVYVKNLSSAYFSDRDKTTRAQLPIRPEFDSIKSSNYPFIFLGYDSINDVFVCWNYHIAKERLNVGKSVSFYSRSFFQSEVKDGELVRKSLKNGDTPVLFKRSSLIDFFRKIDSFFPQNTAPKLFYQEKKGNINYEEKFKNYLKINKKLSGKTIKNYTNALRNRLTDGLRENFFSSLESIYFIESLSILEDLKIRLFEIEEFKNLDFIGKNMYSCAFNNYIDFIKYMNGNSEFEKVKIISDIEEDYCIGGKLKRINDSNLLKEIEPYIKSNRLLSAAQIVGNYYKNKYPQMELSDWINLVRNI